MQLKNQAWIGLQATCSKILLLRKHLSLFRDANDHMGLPALASFPAICSVCLPHTQASSLHTNTPLCPNFSIRLNYERFCKISLRPPQSLIVRASVPTALQLLYLQYIYHLLSSCERKGKYRRKTLLFVDVFIFWLSLFFFSQRLKDSLRWHLISFPIKQSHRPTFKSNLLLLSHLEMMKFCRFLW